MSIPNARVMVSNVTIAQSLEMKQKLSNIDGIDDVTWLDDVVDTDIPLEIEDKDVIEDYYKDNNALFTVTIDEDIEIPKQRREGNGKFLKVIGANQFNLKNIDVEFPLGLFIVVTGLSGSGKSTLVENILMRALHNHFYGKTLTPGSHERIEGLENIDKVIEVDQSPIGRTPRSNPATYTKVLSPIRDLFAATKLAKMRGYDKGRFSFNVKTGRCPTCEGAGVIELEMQFLSNVLVPCEECGGKRFNAETLDVKYKDKTIYDVLEMSVSEAITFFD